MAAPLAHLLDPILALSPALKHLQRIGYVVGAAASVPWLATGLAIRIARQPARATPGPPTTELGPEPPAVANMLATNFKPTADAVPATVLDLAARRAIDVEQVSPGIYQCRIRDGSRPDLTAYETRVLALLRSKAMNGVVPTEALTTGAGRQASEWWRGFRKEVVADAQARGLSRDIWDRKTTSMLATLALVPAVVFGIAIPFWGAFYYGLPAALVFASIVNDRQRDTAAGLAAASRWLGVRRRLEEDPNFPTLPPSAVAVWERYLAYGAALGVAAAAVRAIPVGAESDTRAWTAFGGRWRQVRIRYPTWRSPGWGRPPAAVLFLSVVWGFVAVGLLAGGRGFWHLADDTGILAIRIAGTVIAFLGVLAGMWAVQALVRAALDLRRGVPARGQLIRVRRYGGDNQHTYWAAVDDGRAADIAAFRLTKAQWDPLSEWDLVEATVTPRLGYVRSIAKVGPPPMPAAPGPPPPVGEQIVDPLLLEIRAWRRARSTREPGSEGGTSPPAHP